MILSAITTTDFSSSLYAETSLNLPAGAPFAGRNSHIPLEITGKSKDVTETCQCHSIVNGLHAFDRKACKSCGKCEEECPSNALELFGKEITLEDAGAFLAQLQNVSAVRLLAYHSLARSKFTAVGHPDTMPDVASPNKEMLDKCAEILRSAGVKNVINSLA